MIQTKIYQVSQDEMNREEAIINEHACFGWELLQKDSVVSGSTISQVTLTFQRDSNIPNRQKLDDLYRQYCQEATKIEIAGDSISTPMKTFIMLFSIITLISAVIIFTTFYPWVMELLWDPDLFTTILIIFLMLLLSACCGIMFGVLPLGMSDAIKRGKAKGAVRGKVYAKMRSIANEAAKYL